MNTLLCVVGIVLIAAVLCFFVYALCRMSAQAETYTLYKLEEESKPRITGEL